MPEYVFLKMQPDFPEYREGQDLDIACRDIQEVAEYLKKELPLCEKMRSEDHIHLDLYDIDTIDLRFDLYGLVISKRFTEDLLNNKETMKFWDINIFVPTPLHEGIIKCYEFKYNGKEKYRDYTIYEKNLKEYAP